MWTVLRVAVVALLASALGGCAFLARTSGLELDGRTAGRVAAVRGGAVQVGDVRLTVEPRVPTRGFAMIGPPVVPFLPLGRTDGDPQGPHLIVDFSIETAAKDVRLDVTRLRVELADGTRAHPLALAGPVLPTGGLTWDSNPVNCRDAVKAAVVAPVSSAAGSLAVVGRVCLVVQFDAPVARAEPRFTLHVDGLARDGAPLAVPPLHFERRSRWYYWAVFPFF